MHEEENPRLFKKRNVKYILKNVFHAKLKCNNIMLVYYFAPTYNECYCKSASRYVKF